MAGIPATHHERSQPIDMSVTEPEPELGGLPDTSLNLSWSVPLEIDSDHDDYLGWPAAGRTHDDDDEVSSPSSRPYLRTGAQSNTAKENMIPREMISRQEAVGTCRMQAELDRPIKIGTYNGLAAYLLRTKFSFQRTLSKWQAKIQAADITLLFEDASANPLLAARHPAVAAYYPVLFEGEVSERQISQSMDASLGTGPFGGVVNASVGVGQQRTFTEKGRVVVHGVRGGGSHRNSVTWCIEQDAVAKSGIPREVKLPLIVTTQAEGRFSARLEVKVRYGFWRDTLSRNVPVLGKNDAPLYFDAKVLREMAKMGVERGPDGQLVVEDVGTLDGLDLARLSSFGSG